MVPAVGTRPAAVAAASTSTSTPKPTVDQAAAERTSLADAASDLGGSYQTSKDALVSATTDQYGVHIYRAAETEAFTWRAVATVRPPGIDTDSWIDELCVTDDRTHALVTVAPAAANNDPAGLLAGATAYTVDLNTGHATAVADHVALQYHTPGCGAGSSAVLTRYTDPDLGPATSEVIGVNAASGKVVFDRTLAGQYTSVVPVGGGYDAYGGAQGGIVRIGTSGAPRLLAATQGQAYDLHPGASGGLDYLTTELGTSASAWWLHGTDATSLGTGARDRMYLFDGHGGPDILYGATKVDGTSGAQVRVQSLIDPSAKTPVTQASLAGDAFGRDAVTAPVSEDVVDTSAPNESLPQLVAARGEQLPRTVPAPSAAQVLAAPTAGGSSPRKAAATPTPTCAVPRNDPRRQVLQPNNLQVQWATQLATQGLLGSDHTRPANYLAMGLPAYTVSGDLPPVQLHGAAAGTPIPPQVMYAIMAQETAWKHATFHALPGIAGNALIANYYGSQDGINDVDYPNADCGYGIAQVTSGMRAGQTTFTSDVQDKIAGDYAENIAAGLQILGQKWNQLYDAGITLNNADPRYLENWYFAVWAYNSGVNPGPTTGNTTGCTPSPSCADSDGNWGLGWTNNPLNTAWNPHRDPFLRDSYSDAAHPQDWPYQEKILGWMETPVDTYTGDPAYGTPQYSSTQGGYLNLPQWSQFCTAADDCSPADPSQPNNCTRADYHCWWHSHVDFAQCDTDCATSPITVAADAPEPATNDPHPPDCQLSAPSSAVVVDDLPDPDYNVVGCGTHNWNSSGSFALTTGVDSTGEPVGQIDLHQLGAGFGGHLYFTHDYPASDTAHHVQGTWTVSLASSPYHVMVHIPSTGGTTTSAHYRITTEDGTVQERVVNQYQSQDEWVGLGYFQLGANAKVTLDNVTDDGGLGDRDVAFDAIMFVPTPGTVVSHTFDAVSLFSPDQDLDTNTPSAIDTPQRTMQTLYDWALDYADGGQLWDDTSTYHPGIASQPECAAGALAAACVGPQTWAVADDWANEVRAAGTSPVDHPAGQSEAEWLGYGNDVPPPTAITSTTFADDGSYKVKEHLDVSFVVDGTGTVVPGSAEVTTTARTGTTHLAPFMRDFIQTVSSEYGIAPPDFDYNEYDANAFSGDATPVEPLTTGLAPGRAYVWNAAPVTLSSDGQCVETRSISGGTIGYRPLVGQAAVDQSMSDWVNRLRSDSAVNGTIDDLAVQLYDFYFNPGRLDSSLFNNAAPIWQFLHLGICADGRVYSTESVANPDSPNVATLVDQSYMPNLYLYEDGQQIGQNGAPTTDAVQVGHFDLFANMPVIGGQNSYGTCDTSGGDNGNPWNINPVVDDADIRPATGVYCDMPDSGSFGNPWGDG